MKLNVLIITVFSFALLFITSACPAPQDTAETNQKGQVNQNTPANQNNSNNSVAENTAPSASRTPPSINSILQGKVPTPKNGERREAPKEEKIEPNGVTLENYNKIKVGMTYQEVVAIMGREGESLSDDIKVGGVKSGLYRWSAKGDTAMNISGLFQNGKLLTKNQFGLTE